MINNIIHFSEIILTLLYLSCLFLYAHYFTEPQPNHRRHCRLALRATLFLHFLYLVLLGIHIKHIPMANMYEAMSFLAFATAGVYAFLERRVGEASVGLFILIFGFIFQLFSASFIKHSEVIPEILRHHAVATHIVTAMISYAALAISAIFSVMYLMLYHDIKKHRFGVFYNRLPSLDVLAIYCYLGALVGFVFLTLAIITGAVWSQYTLSSHWYADAKVITVMLSWVIYGALLFLKIVYRWQDRRLAYFSLSGFILTLFSFIAVNLFLTDFHGFLGLP
jgi:ABC-type transport system involved in cytochrome c biogenesis permease subunit